MADHRKEFEMARQSDQIRRLIPPRLIVTALGAAAFLLAIAAANAAGLIIGNPTTSVPRGLYYAASPARAEYATFCLARRHRQAVYYPLFCSPDHPDGLRILKRIAARAPDGHLIVRGDSPRALDSRILGAVHKSPDTRLVARPHTDRGAPKRKAGHPARSPMSLDICNVKKARTPVKEATSHCKRQDASRPGTGARAR